MRGGQGSSDFTGNGRRGRAGLGATALLVALGLAVTASPAAGSVTLGQLATPPLTASNDCSGAQTEFVQTSAAVGNTYRVPGDGTVVGWSTLQGASTAGVQWKLKVFRSTGAANGFQVVVHEGPRALTPNSLNSFPANIPVRAGDVLGLVRGPTTSACVAANSGGAARFLFPSDLADGQSADFSSFPPGDFRLNITAVLDPSNAFTLGALTRNKSKGTAELTINVPGPGEVVASGQGVKAAAAGGGAPATSSATATAKGEVKLLIKAKGKRKRTLFDIGKVKLKPKITYTPSGGAPHDETTKVKLKRN